ncbi:hypothetical protein FOL47_001695 [Perkinsus chesapeaki]|uniref:EF-hand domain-containing protein n=1 Tax=Perkinsus chesapeaki TaxID=330153 RepID=A0A7J6MHZ2_PERCH|nr:hypothetical protein FOL47_001695 [Perkinsus chesapeaki]
MTKVYGMKEDYKGGDEEYDDLIGQQHEPKRIAMVDTVKFNAVIGLFIVLNMLFIGIEADDNPTQKLLEEGVTQSTVQCKSPIEEIKVVTLSVASAVLSKDILRSPGYALGEIKMRSENVFTVVFLLEMILRLKTHRLSYFMDPWNILDFALVWLAIVDTWILTLASECAVSNVRALTTLRVVRMLRLVRFVRLLRMFKELWLIVEGLIHSVRTLAWVAVFLVCLVYVCAIFLTIQVIHRQPLMGLIFMILILSTTYGLLNIVVGVIVENTLGTATRTEEQAEQVKEEEKKSAANSLRRIFELSDADQSGTLSQAEFKAAWKMREVQENFETLGIPMVDAERLFTLMDPTGAGEIKLTEFLASCMQLVSTSQMGHRDITHLSMLVENSSKKVDTLGRKLDALEGAVKAFNMGVLDLCYVAHVRGLVVALSYLFILLPTSDEPPPAVLDRAEVLVDGIGYTV